MHPPSPEMKVAFPVIFRPYIVAGWKATRAEMREAFGEPHYVETDSTKTFGGDEDYWAWDLESGERIAVVLRVPYCQVLAYCDPPNGKRVVEALGLSDRAETNEPVLEPTYHGPI